MLDKFQWKKWILPLALGIIIWLLTPFKPAEINIPAWHLFAIFVATIAACITKPVPLLKLFSRLGFQVIMRE